MKTVKTQKIWIFAASGLMAMGLTQNARGDAASDKAAAQAVVEKVDSFGRIPNCNTNANFKTDFNNDFAEFKRNLLARKMVSPEAYIQRIRVDLAGVDQAVKEMHEKMKGRDWEQFQINVNRDDLTRALNQLYSDMEPMAALAKRLDGRWNPDVIAGSETATVPLIIGLVAARAFRSKELTAGFTLLGILMGASLGEIHARLIKVENRRDAQNINTFTDTLSKELETIATVEKAVYSGSGLPRPSDAASFADVRKYFLPDVK